MNTTVKPSGLTEEDYEQAVLNMVELPGRGHMMFLKNIVAPQIIKDVLNEDD